MFLLWKIIDERPLSLILSPFKHSYKYSHINAFITVFHNSKILHLYSHLLQKDTTEKQKKALNEKPLTIFFNNE